MSQQMVNGSHYDGDVTITNRMSYRYAVVNLPLMGKHRKPQDDYHKSKRHMDWLLRNEALKGRGRKWRA